MKWQPNRSRPVVGVLSRSNPLVGSLATNRALADHTTTDSLTVGRAKVRADSRWRVWLPSSRECISKFGSVCLAFALIDSRRVRLGRDDHYPFLAIAFLILLTTFYGLKQQAKQHVDFLRTTAIGGVFFLLPLVIIGTFLAKFAQYSIIAAKAVDSVVPLQAIGGYPMLLAIGVALVVAACFFAAY